MNRQMRDVEKILLFSASEKCTQEGNLFPRRSIAGICAHLLPAIAWACEELASVQTTLQRWGISLETSVWAAYLPAFPQTSLLQAIPQCPVSSPPGKHFNWQPWQNRHPRARPRHLVAAVCGKGKLLASCAANALCGQPQHAHLYTYNKHKATWVHNV